MRPHNSQSSRENATLSSGTSPLASYKEVLRLMGHYNHSILVDAKIMVSKNYPINGEQVAANFEAQ